MDKICAICLDKRKPLEKLMFPAIFGHSLAQYVKENMMNDRDGSDDWIKPRFQEEDDLACFGAADTFWSSSWLAQSTHERKVAHQWRRARGDTYWTDVYIPRGLNYGSTLKHG